MEIGSVTLFLFATFSSLRIFSYLPQIYRVATDKNGASAISYVTWILWTGANVATALYAIVNLKDMYLALVSGVYAGCCIIVISLTAIQRRRCARRASSSDFARGQAATDEHGQMRRSRVQSLAIVNAVGVIRAISATSSRFAGALRSWLAQAGGSRASSSGEKPLSDQPPVSTASTAIY
jgi:hypothetical protein